MASGKTYTKSTLGSGKISKWVFLKIHKKIKILLTNMYLENKGRLKYNYKGWFPKFATDKWSF